ncbi:NAD(+) diphosphatase [uncultured Sphingomonas sp.]|uniref:NAD(+) diphosphatase n=1 Tax=uncultured Sphingomonas sp. TaxID=158754 RepID=UPI0025E70C51|nr:NAD(+) diphosphatase [uncultured Sphingomonas sp.]
MTFVPGFTGSPLDRCEPARRDPARFAAMVDDSRALILPLAEYIPSVEAAELSWQPLPPLPREELLLMGTIDGIPRFGWIDPQAPGARRTPELMALLATLAPGEAATYAAARSVLDWHARHRFCAQCGGRTHPHHAGWARVCPVCNAEHYPRTDPVAIMLAEYDGRVLVGRQAAFPPGRYSALAGFIEVAESVEEAVARELKEEAGVVATSVRYVSSQPWPFPSQLMIACIATAADDRIQLDMAELEDAKWVDRDQVRAALAGAPDAAFLPPPDYAIANTLFRIWLAEG